tara:strand:- start:363 stop:791 length:429 start_codon:yes stop_codon:yes gene_type:complete
MTKKSNLPYDYLLDHSLPDLERLLENADMFTPETVNSIESIIELKSREKQNSCIITRIVACTFGVKPMDIDVEFVEGLIAEANMDETLGFEYGYTLEEAEVILDNARNIQEADENEWEHAVNNPDHPRHAEIWQKLNAEKSQ